MKGKKVELSSMHGDYDEKVNFSSTGNYGNVLPGEDATHIVWYNR